MNKTMQNKVTELPMADSLITEVTEKTARTPVRVSGFDLEEIGQQAGKEILLQGSVYKLRRMSGFAFVLLRTGRHVIQCVYSSEFSRFGMEELVEESCVRVRALVASEERSRLGWELRLLELQVLSVPAQPMPIVINQKKVDTSLENLLDYRMRQACILLKTTSLSVRAIAHSVSYIDPLYFSRIFRQKMGVSPVEYRKSATS